MLNEIYYAAYGSNLSMEEMKERCPSAIALGVSYLHGYELIFKKYLTIEPNDKKEVPIAIWKITSLDEKRLDEYEDYPNLYRKEYLEVVLNDKTIHVLVYIMIKGEKMHPTEEYFHTCLNGYKDFGLNTEYLYEALRNSE